QILEFLLYQARRLGRKDLEEGTFSIETLLGICVNRYLLLNVSPLLKFINFPRFTTDVYEIYSFEISLNSAIEAKKWFHHRRIFYMEQIIWMYWGSHKRCRTEPMSEVLRLLWSSYPDAYISFKEFR
ncbi:unnamed protein product, partial [Larinioides sclopetarius]